MVSIDTTVCLGGGKCRRDSSDIVGEDVTFLIIAQSSAINVILGRPDPPRHESRYAGSTNLLLRGLLNASSQNLTIVRTIAGFQCISSNNTVHLSQKISLNNPIARTIMLLNSPSCASHMRIARLLLSHCRRNFNHLHISYQTTFLPGFVIVAEFLLGA
ncbi:hypothetical protein TNCV_1523731 [Trichonephila clavipes]|nr:hypothetical protein TNCV_1523731 [Trichonephila clavipes]